MIRKLKNILKLVALLFCVTIFSISCQKDDDFQQQEPTVQQQSKYNTSIVYSNTINKNENLKLALNHLRGGEKSNKLNISSKLIINDSLNIAIEDSSAKYLETADGSYHSYTFVAFDYEHPQGMQNVLLSLQPDGTYREFLLRYDLTPAEIELFRNDEYVDLSGKVSYAELAQNSFAGDLFSKLTVDSNCIIWDITEGQNCTHPGGGGCTWEDGSACNGWGTENTALPGSSQIIGIDWACIDDATNGFNTGPSTSNTSNGPTGGAGLGSFQPTSAGYALTPKQEREKGFRNQIRISDISTCFNGLTNDQVAEITNFLDLTLITIDANGNVLTTNPTSFNQNDIDFAIEAAQAICDGGDFDGPNNVILDPTFIANQKLKCVYDKLIGLSSTVFKDIVVDQFGDASSVRDLRFEVGSIPTQLGGTDAFTYTNYDSTDLVNAPGDIITIRISPTFLQNASTIEIALTLIHESIHAELMDRCIELGLVSNVGTLGHTIFNTGNNNVFTLQDIIFNQLFILYTNPPNPIGSWNHNLFNVLNYRNKMAQNLLDIHPWLNDSNNNFLTNVNNDPFVLGGPYTINELMDYMSWIGLEETAEYTTEISGDALELSRKVYVQSAIRNHYTNTCN